MGKVITVMNMKGGVGKTTVAMHLGGILSRYRKKKVLLIDYDPQFNLSQAFIPASTYFSLEEKGCTSLSILQDDNQNLDPFTLQVPENDNPPSVDKLTHDLPTSRGGVLGIVPSTLELMYVALGQSNKRTAVFEGRFQKFISECRSKYDITIIDCHPAGSILTKTSLGNSDHVVIPVAPDKFAVRGIGLMFKFIESAKVGSQGATPHILFNMASRTGVSSEERSIRSNSDFSKHCFSETMKVYKAFSDPIGGRGFVWFSSAPYSTYAFNNVLAISRELINRVGI